MPACVEPPAHNCCMCVAPPPPICRLPPVCCRCLLHPFVSRVCRLARRFSCPPVHEAVYDPREIPDATKDMQNTVILRPLRDDWLKLLGEMVQMTNEAVRRRASTARDASKPLSLEYMADSEHSCCTIK